MSTGNFHQRLVDELRKEREAIDEVIQAYEVFSDKLAKLPPETVRRVSAILDESHAAASK